MAERKVSLKRKTKETDLEIKLNLDGKGFSKIDYPIPFMAHMLTLFAKHGIFDLTLKVKAADLEVDIHHLIEDTGILLGQALKKALGKKLALERFGNSQVRLPMDESLAEVAIDISGRAHLTFKAPFRRMRLPVIFAPKREFIFELEEEMMREFFEALALNAGITLHIDLVRGKNSHHKLEAVFKAFGVALCRATQQNPRKKGVSSTKGKL